MNDPKGGLSRRRFMQSTGVAAATAGIAQVEQSHAAPAAAASTWPPWGWLGRRPNLLLILCDEYRFPVAYESSALQQFRARYLTAEESLRDNGLEFTSHYIMTSACVPSRTSIFTGQYPSLHGDSQTPGAAKGSTEADMFWLDQNTVPTMGNYFRAGGYETYYKGKWHVSDADIHIPGTNSPLLTFNSAGEPDPAAENTYLTADRLSPYGFSGWIGPEPHGSNPLNSGSSATGAIGRDEKFATQAVDLLNQLSARENPERPWLLVNSYVNPHDVTVWGDFTLANQSWNLRGQLTGSVVPDQPFELDQYASTSTEDLAGKPQCQQDFVDLYPQVFQPLLNTPEYHRFYYQLQRNVNQQIQRVLDALHAHPDMAANTIVIFTSDHGDLLGAHGGMHQKWHQAYEESTHVPFIVHNPALFKGRQTLDALTSHADLLPTMLGLAGLDPSRLRHQLAKSHTEVHPLVGRDLSRVILGESSPSQVTGPVYFMTEDEVSRGSSQTSALGHEYLPVMQPNTVETVVAYLATGANGSREKWKYSRYSDNPQFWSTPNPSPGPQQDVTTQVDGDMFLAGDKQAVTTIKTQPVPDQAEAYNLSQDPLELVNLVPSTDPAVQATISELETMLHQQCAAKLLKPSSGTVPGQPDC